MGIGTSTSWIGESGLIEVYGVVGGRVVGALEIVRIAAGGRSWSPTLTTS